MKQHSITTLLFLLFLNSTAQPLEQQNDTIVNKSVVECGTDLLHKRLLANDSNYKNKQEAFEEYVKTQVQKTGRASSVSQIPVVVHIMHSGEQIGSGTNITNEEVRKGIYNLNQRFRKTPNSLGDGNGVDLEVEFVLAVRDESDNCTDGIVRYDMSAQTIYGNNGVNFQGNSGLSDVSLKSLSRWDPTEYYNIYIVSKIDAENCNENDGTYVGGFATFAGAHGSASDATVILTCNYLDSTSTTFTHEMGHAFNLYHTFEGDLDGTSCPTGNGDYCDDTPQHIRYSSHPQFINQLNNCSFAVANSCDGGTTQDHMNNYMDYSYEICTNEFTPDQKLRVQASISSLRSSYLSSNGNKSLIPPTIANVDFTISSSAICPGSSIQFIDNSTCIPNNYRNSPWDDISFLWTFDNHINTPITSTLQNPTVLFSDIGIYDVSLQITNNFGTTSRSKPEYIAVALSNTNVCIPATGINEGNFGYLISNCTFNTINNTTSSTYNISYSDFRCNNSTIVRAKESYPLSISSRAGITSGYAEQIQVYIDWNNDGIFTETELVLIDSTDNNSTKTKTKNILIPNSAVQGKTLTMRVYGEGNILSDNEISCSSTMFLPDVEDYGVYILSAYETPEVEFSFSSDTWCNGDNVFFNDSSINVPTNYSWTFENGIPSTSEEQNPVVKYTTPGSYQVTLSASNPAGSSSNTHTITIKDCNATIIYSNPIRDVLEIRLPFIIENGKLRLIDLNGKILFEMIDFESSFIQINTSLINNGIYMLQVETENGIEVFKIVKV